MKRFTANALASAFLVLSAPALCGCSTLRQLTARTTQVELSGAQTLYIAEAAFAGASIGLERAVDAGELKGAAAAKARTAYDTAHAALLAARQAEAAGDAALAAAKAADAIAGSGQVEQLALHGGVSAQTRL